MKVKPNKDPEEVEHVETYHLIGLLSDSYKLLERLIYYDTKELYMFPF